MIKNGVNEVLQNSRNKANTSGENIFLSKKNEHRVL